MSTTQETFAMKNLPGVKTQMLSHHQERLWFIEEFERGNVYPESPTYHNVPLILELRDRPSENHLEDAINRLVSRHEVLRTGLAMDGTQPLQTIKPEVSVPLEYLTLADSTSAPGRTAVLDQLLAWAMQPMDLRREPLMRAGWGTADGRHWLVLVFHHILVDRSSLAILARELDELYGSARHGQASQLPSPKLQYSDFIRWQRNLPSNVLETQFLYWKRQLGRTPKLLELPENRRRPAIHTYTPRRAYRMMPAEFVARLEAVAHQEGVTLGAALLAGFMVVLRTYSRQDEILVGTSMRNRRLAGTATLVGPVENLVVVRAQIEAEKPCRQVLVEVKTALDHAAQHQDIPFDLLVQRLNPPKDMSRTALFDVLFQFEDEGAGSGELEQLGGRVARTNAGFGKYDFNLEAVKTDAGLSLALAWNEDIYDRWFAEQMFNHILVAWAQLANDPQPRVQDLALLSELEEAAQIGRAVTGVSDEPKTLQARFEVQAARHADRVAVTCGEASICYGDLDTRANRIAHYLREKGVTRQQLVGVCLQRSIDVVATFLGILKAGAAYLPIDPANPRDRLQFICKDAQLTCIITETRFTALFTEVTAGLIQLDGADAPLIAQCSDAGLENLNAPDDLAYCIYTSGSTGLPKGVLVEHRNVIDLVCPADLPYSFGPDDGWTMFHSYAFDFSVWEMYGALLYGGRLIVVPQDIARNSAAFADLLVRENVTVLNQTPSAFQPLAAEILERERGPLSLRYVIFGGEALDPARLKPWMERYPEVEMCNMYGITETTVHTTFKRIGAAEVALADSNIGVGHPTATVYVFDEYKRLLPCGVAGELYVGGTGVARGYFNRDTLNRERFIENPYRSGERLYRSGDLAKRLPNGELLYLGRIDHQVKIRGFRVELGEIEAAIQNHRQVSAAVVLARTVGKSTDKALCAYFVATEGLDPLDLRDSLRDRLPPYMVPDYFVRMDHLPLTGNGKTDRKALPEPDVNGGRDYVEPRTAAERKMATLFAAVLGHEKIGMNDSFFELGGHSLKAIQLAARIRKEFEVEVGLKDLFTAPTVGTLLEVLRTRRSAKFEAIEPAPVQARYLASPAQERMFVLQQLNQGTAYNIPAAYRVEGELDVAECQRAINQVVARHEALRTSFELVEGQVWQRIAPQATCVIETIDDPALTPEGLMRDFVRPFDLAQAPLLRVRIVRQGAGQQLIAIDLHHIVADLTSSEILVRDFWASYGGQAFASLPIHYKDYSAWEHRRLAADGNATAQQYWLDRFSGELPESTLPADFPRPAMPSFAGRRHEFTIGADLRNALAALCEREQLTPYVAALAAFKILLAKCAGEEDVIVGAPVSGRDHPDLEEVVGVFVNLVALRTAPAAHKSLRTFANEVKEAMLGALAHQQYPFEELVKRVAPTRDTSRNPLFSTMFLMGGAGRGAMTSTKLRLEPVQFDIVQTKLDLTVGVRECEEGLAVSFEYATDLFTPATIARLGVGFERVLRALVSAPDQCIRDVATLSEVDETWLLKTYNDTAKTYPVACDAVHQLFEAQVRRTPQAIAVSLGDHRLTYAQLDARANQLARRLRALGVGPDCLVGLLADRSLEMMVGLWSVLKAGGAYVPLDPAAPVQRIRGIVEQSRCTVVLTTRDLASAEELGCATLALDNETLFSGPADALENLAQPENLAYVIFTSGSTGVPKGVMISHAGIVNYLLWTQQAYAVEGGTGALVHSPLTFDLTLTGLLAPLTVGQRVILVNGDDGSEALNNALPGQADLTLVKITPAHLALLGDILPVEQLAGRTRAFVIGGEALKPETVQHWRRHAPQTRLINEYGPTETVVGCCVYEATDADFGRSGPMAIGRPIANTQLYVLDRDLRPVLPGVVGELYIGGSGLARGYLGNPAQTAQTFVANPFDRVDGSRLYKTGDRVRHRVDGELEFLGRADHQVKIRGYRIELEEIETQLQLHEGVRQCVALVLEDRPGEKRLAMAVVAQPGATVGEGELREHLRAKVPSYMIPTEWLFLPELPLTKNGKVDRKRLPVFRPERRVSAPPRDAWEAKIAALFSAVLGQAELGRDDEFFALGGDSLKAIRLVARLRQELGVELALRELFAHPTVASLAEQLRRRIETVVQPIARTERRDYYPTSSVQTRMYALQQLDGGTAYNMPALFQVRGALDADRVEQALQAVVAAHEALRTSFDLVAGELVQRVHPRVALRVERSRDGDTEVSEVLRKFVRPFDLARAPLLRALVVERGPDEFWLCFDVHHIVCDALSLRVLIADFVRAYEGQPLAEPAVQYPDFTVWQAERASTEEGRADAEYWSAQMAGELPTLELPTDFPRPSTQSFEGASVQHHIPAAVGEKLERLAREEGATLFTLLLAGYQALLSRYSNQDDIVVGTSVMGRTRAELQSTIGMFVNAIALRAAPKPSKTFREFLREVRQVVIGGLEHQGYPFEELINRINARRDMSRNPVFDTLFEVDRWSSVQEYEFAGLKASPLRMESTVARFDLRVDVQAGANGLLALFEYNPRLFRRETIERMGRHFEAVLRTVADAPETALADLDVIGDPERAALARFSRAGGEVALPELGLHEQFEEAVRRHPTQLAVTDGQEALTYDELNRRSNCLARRLRSEGIQTDEVVGILADRSSAMIVGMLATLKAGAAYLSLDPDYPAERREALLKASGARVVLAEIQHLIRLTSEATVVPLDVTEVSEAEAGNLDLAISERTAVYVIYTSGSTGRPKGVVVERAGLANLVAAYRAAIGDLDTRRVSQVASASFDAMAFEIWPCLCLGGTLCIADDGTRSDPAALQAWLASEAVEYAYQPTIMAETLLQNWPRAVGTAPHTLLAAGDRLNLRPPADAPVDFFNLYGPTEATVWATSGKVTPGDATPISIGRPIGNVRVYVLDPLQRPVPVGTTGELCIGGPGVARGYLGNPEATAEKFVADPFQDGARLYRTGDYARWTATGELHFQGRIDEQVKVRGYRIELGEVESALRRHPQIAEAVVVARVVGGQGQKSLCSYFVANVADLDAAALETFLAATLPAHLIPTYWVKLDRLPVTTSGKVDRKALPEPEATRRNGAFSAPQTAVEQILARVFSQVLGAKEVGLTDDFFELGGDSIKAIQIAARLRTEGYELSVTELFRHPKIEQLSERVQRLVEETDEGPVQGEAVATPIQRWFLDTPHEQRWHWNQAIVLKRAQGYEAGLVATVLQAIVDHHDALGAVLAGDRLHYLERTQRSVAVERIDVSGSSWQADLAADATQLQASLDLEKGPLLKAAVCSTPEGGYLLVVAHHLVVDGVSWRILIEDIETAYAQVEQAHPVKLPRRTHSFKLWAEKLAAYAQTAEARRQLDYWRRTCGESCVALPGQPRRTKEKERQTVWVELNDEGGRALLGEVHRAYNTDTNDLLLCAFGRAVAKWIGSGSVRVHLEGHGREELLPGINVTRTVGWFTSLYPVVVEAAQDEVGAHLRRTKEQLRRIPQKGVGYGILRYLTELTEEERAALSSTMDLTFNYLGQIGREQVAAVPSGEAMGPENEAPSALAVNGLMYGDRLRLNFTFDAVRFGRAEMETLAANCLQELETLIAHCQARRERVYTASDLGDSSLVEADVARLWQPERIERVGAAGPLQKGIYFHHEFATESRAHVLQLALDIEGTFDREAFVRSLNRLMERHETLRSNFVYFETTGFRQVIYREKPMVLTWHESADGAWLDEEFHCTFDLQRGPLFRVAVAPKSPTCHRLALTWHHIILDGWSTPILLQELFALYRAHRQGVQAKLETPWSLATYMRWLESREVEPARAHWRTYLEGYAQREYPWTNYRGEDYQLRELSWETDAELTEAIQRLSVERRVTPSTIFQVAWSLVLQRLQGGEDVLFGHVISGRSGDWPGIERAVGFFINTVPARFRAAAHETVGAVLMRHQQQALQNESHGILSLPEIQEAARLERGAIDHLFTFENYPIERTAETLDDAADAMEIRTVHGREQSNYPFEVLVAHAKQFIVKLRYNEHALGGSVVAQLSARLERVLRAIVTDSEAQIGAIEWLSETEREQVREYGLGPVHAVEGTIHGLFAAQAERTPEAIALVVEGEQVTYGELERRANRFARRLRESGVKPGERVGLMADRSVELIVGMIGILKAGTAYVPIDPEYPSERIEYLLADSGCRVLLTPMRYLPDCSSYAVEVMGLEDGPLAEGEGSPIEDTATPLSLAYVMYTSGTTGRPKGVLTPHAGVVRVTCNPGYIETGPDHRVLQLAPTTFDASTLEIWAALLNGGRLVLAPGGVQSVEEIGNLVKSEGITTMWLSAGLFHVMVEEQLSGLAGVKQLLAGGDVLSRSHVAKALAGLPGCQLINGYGPTENTTFTCCHVIRLADTEANSIPIGRPVANTRVYLLDLQLRPVPAGVTGELYTGGRGLAWGYLNRPDATAETFVADPFAAGERMYRTGDYARWRENGEVEFLGRGDDQVKVRGFRVELGEIENALRSYPRVAEAVVVARVVGGQGEKSLCAYYVERDGALEPAALESYLESKLPAQMLPSYWVKLERLPLTANGKVDRKHLPEPEATRRASDYQAPRSEAEQLLARVFTHVLNAKEVGASDDFFERGGDSIKAIQIVARLRTEGYEVSVGDVFRYPKIEQLADRVQRAAAAEQEGVIEGAVVATPIQRWFLEAGHPQRSHWNQAVVLHRAQGYDAALVAPALQATVQHHDALGAILSGDQLLYLNRANRPVVIERIEAQGSQWRAELAEAATRLQASMDLERAPLVKAAVCSTPEGAYLLVVVHHLVIDGVSWRILIEDLESAYVQLERGLAVTLPGRTHSFKLWAERLAAYAQTAEARKQYDYWQQVCTAPCLALPGERRRAQEKDRQSVWVELSEEDGRALLGEAHRVYNTEINDILLCALGRALAAWIGHGSIRVQLEGHGREEILSGVNITRTIGWFTSLYPLLLDAARDDHGAHLRRTKEALRAIPQKGVGYGILRYLAPLSPEERAALAVESDLTFNYLGQIGRDQIAAVSSGQAVGSENYATSPISVDGLMYGERLRLNFSFDALRFARPEIETLAQDCLSELQQLIDHCQGQSNRVYTASDLGDSSLTADEIDEILA